MENETQKRDFGKTLILSVQVFLTLYSFSLLLSMAGMEIFGWLTAIIILGTVVLSKKISFYRTGFEWPLGILFVSVAISITLNGLWSPDGIHIIGRLRWMILFYLMTVALKYFYPQNIVRVFGWITWAGFFLGLYSVIQHFYGWDFAHGHFGPQYKKYVIAMIPKVSRWRSTGFFSMPLTYAYSIGVFSCLILALFLQKSFSKRMHLIAGLASLFLLVSIFTSYTRGAWAATIASTMFILFLAFDRKKFLIALSAFTLFAAAVVSTSTTFRDRFTSIFDAKYASNSGRVDIWRANIEIFKDNPVWGVGYDQSSKHVEKYYQKLGIDSEFFSHAHNNFLQMLSGAGLVGFLAYMAMMVIFFTLAWRLWKRLPEEKSVDRAIGLGAMGAQINLHIGGLTECNFKDAEVNHIFIFMMALVAFRYYENFTSKNA